MTPNEQTVQHRRTWTHDPERVRVEDVEGEGLWKVRMPLASTAEARDGRALERDVIEGWREQIEAEPLPLFLDHGSDDLTGHRYGQLGRVGYWTDPETVERDDGVVDLEADAVVVGPEAVDEDAGQYREALSWLRTQAELLPLASSAGWSEDTGSRDPPGGFDLMEASLVGIPSDERTTTASADPVAMARAVEAASEEFDAETFLRELGQENANMTDDDTPADDAGDEPDEQHEESADEWRMTEDKYDRLMSRMDDLEAANDEELEILREMYEADYSDDESDDGEDEDEGGEADDESSDEPDEESAAETEDDTEERTVTIDGKEVDADEALDRLRDVAADDPDPDEPETRDVGDETDVEGEEAAADEQRDDTPDTDDETPSFSFS